MPDYQWENVVSRERADCRDGILMQRRCGGQIPGICAAVPVAAGRCYLVRHTAQSDSLYGQRSPGRRRWVGRSRTVFCQLLLLMVKQGASISRPSPHVPSQSGHQPRHHTRGHTSDLQRQAGGRLSNILIPYSQYIWWTLVRSRGLVRWGGVPGPAPPRATGCVPRSRVSGQVFRATSANNDDILATACTICTGGHMSGEHSGQLDI